ncbi:DivIVA domain-containing protein [Micromonospora sp. NPDC050187]|uniref:DivIVA domain-containing protein n=1 Tax=Micromonospora sp. NPDC050187 TaxID=3364277 RepID=UPI00379F4DB1
MRVLVQRRWRSCGGRHHRPESEARPGGGLYRSAVCAPLGPWQVRGRRFSLARRWRRGLDPDEVHDFLDRVADDLATAYELLDRSQQETSRIKEALRRWQSQYAPRVDEQSYC